jgi:Na+/H+-dicarboxylate symporter
MFRKMPWLLAGIILLCVLLDQWIPLQLKSFLYALSLTIKSGIIFILPVVIFSLLFKTAVQLAYQATKMIAFILVAICCSSFLATFLSHFVGSVVYDFDISLISPTSVDSLAPLWKFSLPSLVSNDKALWAGLLGGVLLSYIRPIFADQLSEKLAMAMNVILKGITYLIPFFVTGFVLKLNHDGSIMMIVRDYAVIFAVIMGAQFSYIAFLYFAANGFKIRTCIASVQNMLPAAIAGFSTMSSAASMPLTLIGTQKNTKTGLSTSVIPMTVNVHLIGDCFALPILAYAILKNYGLAEPMLMDYLIFAGYFVLAKFSVAGVPGGGVLVMLPILENHLGFNAEMLSLITALYILFDPVITSANVLGNGAFAMIMDKINGWFSRPVPAVREPA